MFAASYFPTAYFPPGWRAFTSGADALGPPTGGGVIRKKREPKFETQREAMRAETRHETGMDDDEDDIMMILFLTGQV